MSENSELNQQTKETRTPKTTGPQPMVGLKGESRRNIFKLVIASLLLLGLIVVGISLNWNAFKQLFTTTESIQTTSPPTQGKLAKDIRRVSIGTQTVKVLPGLADEKQFLLPDQETKILFGNIGRPDSVPDLVFGEKYSLNDIHKINSLAIKNEISFYNNGYFIALKNQGCNTETRFTDMAEIWVTDCSIQVTSKEEKAPVKKLEAFSRTFNTETPFSGVITKPEDPFIYLTVPKLSVQNFSTPLSSENVSFYGASNGNIQMITSYGIETISYTAQEIWDKETKQIIIGPLTLLSHIDNLDCKVIFTGGEGQQTERCKIIVNLSFSQDKTSLAPIKLLSYTP